MNKFEQLRKLADLGQAMEPTDEVNLTWEELAQSLGVKVGEDGNLNGVDMFNACLQVQSNEAVQALPTEQRVRVIRSVGDALSALQSGSLE
ncbi:hypothetical protein COT75_01365 [Candidatus Beckwithbacteria bacterium CG10_big_fil_rev_8_21_14_0_10_34_10]|uniref:Uncharacterized protein n=1 Tax=Candidatus Beckwithbacteria bacterium CG10_big_fil_rev_8_21_14_0_10_34_10 TaxID=1974495 RepID=A0A2H0WC02_9BACT|nr:MAG: hypothetical protein COT75_01365 [Candidatus Beckwithbacteria bacterium CG10_big_fil_rev_8_21_14_0_10_34_10]